MHAGGHAAEHDLAAPVAAHGKRARAVDRRPDDLGSRIVEDDRRSVQRLASRDETDTDLETVLANTTDETLAELRCPVSDMPLPRRIGHGDGDRSRGFEVDRCRTRFGDERVAVEELRAVAVALDRERAVERRRQAQRDLDFLGIDEGGEPTAGVASVRRGERAAKVVGQDDLHAPEPS